MAENNSQNNKDNDFDIDLMDLEDISLDELDGFDGIDFDNLELDDIDFDDLDVTSLDTEKTAPPKAKKKEVEDDFDFDALLEEEIGNVGKEEEAPKKEAKPKEEQSVDDFLNDINLDSGDDVFNDADNMMQEDTSTPVADDMDALFASLEAEESENMSFGSEDIGGGSDASADGLDGFDGGSEMSFEGEDYSAAGSDLDDLFQQSMEFSLENGELDDIEDIGEVKSSSKKGKKKKTKDGEEKEKKSLSEILFGEPDEDDLEEEQYFTEKKAKDEIKKAEKKEKKAEQKAIKDAKKQEALAVKEKAEKEKNKAKADKKAAAEAEYREELEREKEQKKVPTAVVIIVFAAFAALGAFVILGTKSFDYNRVIEKATDYFDRQRYRLAYDEIAGVDVKPKDEELKDRIYTVMYVERLYESYENNMTLNRPDKALDALIRGLEKYDEHYQEAVELGIVADIDTCKKKIISSLWSTYSITEQEAYVIMSMTGQEYTNALTSYSDNVNVSGE